MVQVPYRHDGPSGLVSMFVDSNEDGVCSDAERVLADVPVQPQKYWNTNFFFRPTAPLPPSARVCIRFGDESIVRVVRISNTDAAITRTDTSDVTLPLESMKEGDGASTTSDIGSYRYPDVPDIRQRVAECGPAAAANSMVSLAKEHGQDGRLPSDMMVMLDELRSDMRWTATDGVLSDMFVVGANLWSRKKGLPILTTKVGTQQGAGTLDTIDAALEAGDAAALRLSFSTSESGPLGGHVVTVVGVTQGARTFISIHDPRSPNGTDIYEVKNNAIDYALFDGTTTLSWGFIHTWTDGEL
jgi:hypothetical protein